MARSAIVSAVRTPFGRLGGGLKDYQATQLGAIAIKAGLERIGLEPQEVEYVIMGQVLQGGGGQAPGRQAAIAASIPIEVPAEVINKVCASSLRAVQIADTMIRAGDLSVIVTGGGGFVSRCAIPSKRRIRSTAETYKEPCRKATPTGISKPRATVVTSSAR